MFFRINRNFVIAAGLSICFLVFSSCNTQAAAERRLAPPKSISDLRLNDISRYVSEDPAMAIHLIETYKIIYGPGTVYPDGENPEIMQQLSDYTDAAVANLKSMQAKAIDEKRWSDAASLARSLSAMGISVESTGAEPDITLQYAKDQIGKNNLTAFLAAAQAQSLKPLGFDDALFFLQQAVNLKQRRTAAFFLNIIDTQAQASDQSTSANLSVPSELFPFFSVVTNSSS